MWKIVFGVIVVTACGQAQSSRDLLLPQARHIAGVVVDREGKPVTDARIDHTNDKGHAYKTDSEGKFDLSTNAPVLVVRKPGFRSEVVRTQDTTSSRVILQNLGGNQAFPTCSKTGQYDGITVWGTSFQFLKMSGVKAIRQGQDVDIASRGYYVETQQGRKVIQHGSGLLWSFGTPSDKDVWRSVKYEEATYDVSGVMIIDARGQLSNGNHWRYLGKPGESASYSDIDDATAKILDQFLDGACLRSAPQR